MGGRGGDQLVVVPVVLHYLGTERYGVFATITAIAGLVGWADLGLGNGLISEVAAAQGRDDSDSTARAVSTAFFALLGLAVLWGSCSQSSTRSSLGTRFSTSAETLQPELARLPQPSPWESFWHCPWESCSGLKLECRRCL